MPKFVALVNSDGYRKYTSNAAKVGSADVPSFSSKLQEKFFKIHNAWPLNKSHELPWKGIWYRHCFDERKLMDNVDIYFICYESFHMSYSRRYLKHIRDKFTNAKLVFYFSNPVNEYNLTRLESVRQFYDEVMTFNERDAIENSFLYCNCDAFLLPTIEVDDKLENDVFFIGADKGRLGLILSVYKRLTDAGINCDFHIVNVPPQKQNYVDCITYNHRIPYEDVLRRVKSSKCVLEILPKGNHYYSIRTMEALQYHKKLLTTNMEVNKQWFYKSEIIQTFSDVSEIDTDFILESVNDEIYQDIEIGTFERLANFVVENVERRIT